MDKSALRARFARLEDCLVKVRSILDGVGEEAYLTDPFVQDVVERNLQVASQIILDVCTHLIAEQAWESPDTYEDAIVTLARRGVLPDRLAKGLRGMAGFRNILVHEYLEVNPQIVYAVATDHLDDYEEFARCVAAWVERIGGS